MRRWVVAIVLVLIASAPVHAGETSPKRQSRDAAALARARALYNEGNYDAAVEAATEALKAPSASDPASLVLGRALMERYRRGAQAPDLAAAREALTRVRQQALAPQERIDLLVGLGQLLFLGEAFGAAAELFDNALAQNGPQPSHTRSQLLDWWASALSREAQSRPPDKRAPVYQRIVERMEQELRADPGSAPASYWLPVGARGVGDLERAWDAAIAGWVRASLSPDTAASLRADLDRLVTQALVTERARQRQIPGRDIPDTAAALLGEWDLIKSQWK